MQADYGMLLARTDFSVPKHHGISWFAFPLDQPGVTIRPLREMTGEAVFNEVFLDDAVVDAADLIGGEGNGWAVTQTTLYFERTGIGAGGSHAGFPVPGPKGGMLGRRAGDAATDPVPGRQPDPHASRSDRARPSRAAAPPTRTSARSSPGSTRTRSSASGTRSGRRRRRPRAAARPSPTSARSRRRGS